jgi:hypothetical protein
VSAYGTTWIRAYRLALGIALADVVAQVKARYVAEERKVPAIQRDVAVRLRERAEAAWA